MKQTIGGIHSIKSPIPKMFQNGIVKYRVLYNAKEIIDRSYSFYQIPKIRNLKIVNDNQIDYHFKYADRSHIEKLLLQKGDCDDIIIVRNGLITDTSFCNIVLKNENGLYTPKNPLLKGCQRAYLLAQQRLIEADIKLENLKNYDSIILINAMLKNMELTLPCTSILTN